MKIPIAERAMAVRGNLIANSLTKPAHNRRTSKTKAPQAPHDETICVPTDATEQNIIRTQTSITNATPIPIVEPKKEQPPSTETNDNCADAHSVQPAHMRESNGQNLGWSPHDQALITWYVNLPHDKRPALPFKLTPWMTVMGPQFYDRLHESIAAGPTGARARYGAFQADIQRLKDYIETH